MNLFLSVYVAGQIREFCCRGLMQGTGTYPEICAWSSPTDFRLIKEQAYMRKLSKYSTVLSQDDEDMMRTYAECVDVLPRFFKGPQIYIFCSAIESYYKSRSGASSVVRTLALNALQPEPNSPGRRSQDIERNHCLASALKRPEVA